MRSFPAAAGRAFHVRMLLGMLAVATAVLTAVTTATAAAPPGRAYERVSPADKGGGDVVVGWRAANGAVAYSALSAFAGTPGIALISQYVARRGATDWTTAPYHPMPFGPGGFNSIFLPTTMTSDMSRMVGSSPAAFNADDADNGSIDIWEVGPNVSVDLLSQGPVDPVPDGRQGEAVATGMSADGSHVVFESTLEMAPGATAGNEQVYDRTGGQTVLVGIDESGVPLPAAEAGGGRAFSGATGDFHEPSSVSRDGSRIFFATPPPRALFVRENGTTSTEYSASQRTGSVGTPATDADFQMATPDGESVFFISPDLLTDDATPGGGLYRYDLGSDDLTFLSTGSTDPAGAQVQGVVQVSDDGERAYFVANDALGGEGAAGSPNLYLADATGLTFIGTLSPADAGVWSGQGEGYRLADVTPDGSRLVFTSEAQLGTVPHPGVQQVYLYDAAAGETTCISCPPGPPTGSASLDELGNALFFNSIPGGITADGRTILFQAADPLVPNDSNAAPDAYIWEGGSLHLLASGASTAPTIIGGMSEDGTDVYFLTRDSLVPADQDEGQFDIYDARRGGGLPAQQHVPADPCEGDACRPGPPPARFDPPATIGFSGAGNVDQQPRASFAVRAISGSARRRFARTGRLTLRVRVSEAGRVRARATSGGDTVAGASRRARRAGTVRLTLRLSRAARNRLERRGRLRVTLRVTFSGRASVTRFTLRSGGGR